MYVWEKHDPADDFCRCQRCIDLRNREPPVHPKEMYPDYKTLEEHLAEMPEEPDDYSGEAEDEGEDENEEPPANAYQLVRFRFRSYFVKE